MSFFFLNTQRITIPLSRFEIPQESLFEGSNYRNPLDPEQIPQIRPAEATVRSGHNGAAAEAEMTETGLACISLFC